MATDGGGTRTIKASEFKAKCLQLMDEVAESGEEIIITKYGRPVSKLIPYRRKPKSFFGADKGRMKDHWRHHQSYRCRMGSRDQSEQGA